MPFKPSCPPLLWLAFVGSGCVAPGPDASSETDPSGSTTAPEPPASDTDPTASTGTTATVDTDPSSDTTGLGCDAGCPPEETDEVCPRDLAAGSDLFALGIRHTWTASDDDCGDACTTPRSVVYAIDPTSAGLTELAIGELGTVPSACVVADDGSFVIVGELAPLDFEPGDESIERLAPTGETVWSLVLSGGIVSDVALRGDEVIAVTSGRLSAFSLADGSPLWDVPDADPSLARVELDVAGNVYAGGESDDRLLVRKLDPAQAQLWEVLDPAVEGMNVMLTALAVDEAGGVVTASRTWSSDDGDDSVVLRKLDADGLEAWTHTMDEGGPAAGKADDYVLDLVTRPGGGVVAVGQAAIDGGVASAVAFDADGNELWSETYDHRETDGARFVAAALDAGEVFAVGCVEQPEPPYEGDRWISTFAP
jgi:hypothetical protein